MNTNYGMTIEEIRTSVTMALCKSITTEDQQITYQNFNGR